VLPLFRQMLLFEGLIPGHTAGRVFFSMSGHPILDFGLGNILNAEFGVRIAE
jgi:hypothetical protein